MVAQWFFIFAWLIVGLILGAKSIQKPNSLLMFVSAGCFIASVVAFLEAPFALQMIIFLVGTLSILIVEEA